MTAGPPRSTLRGDRIAGVLLGTAVGDALGLPREGLSPRRAQRIFGDDLRHALVRGRGMLSDDTELTCLVAQALLRGRSEPAAFARTLAWKLRFWILGLPAGVGLGTAKAIARLWLGFGPGTAGVWSAGNGPAMRAALLGVCREDDPRVLREWVRASTRVTHADPRAERAAFLVAFAAGRAARSAAGDIAASAFLPQALEALGDADDELRGIFSLMGAGLARGATIRDFAAALGLSRGVSGYAYHTVPVALYAWLVHPGDFRGAVTDVIRLGGDTDTTGAIVGAICGAGVGVSGIPAEWIDGLWEWPRSVAWMTGLAERLARRFPDEGAADAGTGEMPLAWPAVLPRNLLFLTIVLAHGLRRLLPPYDAREPRRGRGGSGEEELPPA